MFIAVRTGLEPATPGVTGRYSNQLNYRTNFKELLFSVEVFSSNADAKIRKFSYAPNFFLENIVKNVSAADTIKGLSESGQAFYYAMQMLFDIDNAFAVSCSGLFDLWYYHIEHTVFHFGADLVSFNIVRQDHRLLEFAVRKFATEIMSVLAVFFFFVGFLFHLYGEVAVFIDMHLEVILLHARCGNFDFIVVLIF